MLETRPSTVLVVDDEPDLRSLYELSLSSDRHAVDSASDVQSALRILQHHQFDVVLTDMRLPDGLGLELVLWLQQHQRAEQCVVITAYASAENAVQALKAGAFDYLTKPVDVTRLRQVVRDALRHAAPANVGRTDQAQVQTARRHADAGVEHNASAVDALNRIVGSSAVMRELKARVAKVARSMAPVLVCGESGTGKELIARAVHECSHRASGPFVAVNCAAIPENLLEAEFFGARKGAYTGAAMDRVGFFQAAHSGTLFLDEIGELPLPMQSKLLRAIQERRIRPLGESQEQAVDVRLVSATHRDLAADVQAASFRQDLYYRINVIELRLPPLRERRQDLPELVAALLTKLAGDADGRYGLSARARDLLAQHPLRGNVRELENILHRALALADGPDSELDLEDSHAPSVDPEVECATDTKMGATVEASTVPKDLQAFLDVQEREILVTALAAHSYNRSAAAQQLGISLRQIRYRMQRLNIDVPATDEA